MEARYAVRKSPLLDECQVAPEIFEQVLPRLEAFMKPFVRIFQGQAADATCQHLCLWPVVKRRTEKHRIDCRSFWPVPPAAARLHWVWTRGTMRRYARSCGAKSGGTWDKAMGCWCSIRPGFPSPVGSRWGWHGSGVGAWAQSITAKSPSIWAMCPARATPWSTPGCLCRKHGPKRRRAWTKRACPQRPAPLAPVTSWSWRCWRTTVPRSPIGGVPGMTRWGVRPGSVVA